MPDIKGVDVASWQGTPAQWVHDPGAQGIQWAAVKFSELQPGNIDYENPDAKADWDWLWWQENHEGHPMGRIAYLYAHPSVSVGATVSAFKNMTDRLGLLPGDGVCVDLETTDNMSPAAVASWARALFAELEALYGRRVILYTYISFITSGNCEGLENYPLWIASITTPGIPQVPAPFKDWFAQQYSQAGNIDQDVAHFSSLAAMRAAMGKPEFQTVVAVHVTTGEESIVALSHLLQTEISTILRLTLNGSANHIFAGDLSNYINVGNFQANMAKGITLRYYETIRA
jgi:lysozyme